jgi:hypothetical protein
MVYVVTGEDDALSPKPAWSMSTMKRVDKEEGEPARNSMCAHLMKQAVGKCELADVRIHIGGVWVASGHRCVLCAKSPVFSRMFMNNTEEKNTGILRLDDVTVEGLQTFLELVYLGTLCLLLSWC